MGEITLPEQLKKVNPVVLVAVAAAGLAVFFLKPKSDNGNSSSGVTNDLLSSEVDQRLKEQYEYFTGYINDKLQEQQGPVNGPGSETPVLPPPVVPPVTPAPAPNPGKSLTELGGTPILEYGPVPVLREPSQPVTLQPPVITSGPNPTVEPMPGVIITAMGPVLPSGPYVGFPPLETYTQPVTPVSSGPKPTVRTNPKLADDGKSYNQAKKAAAAEKARKKKG